MLLGPLLVLLVIALWLYALIDCVTTDAAQCRHLPKVVWLLIVFFAPVVGSVLWLAVGRPPGARAPSRRPNYANPHRGAVTEDHPRYSATPGISDRRSAELDLEIERWEQRQREQRAGGNDDV